MGHEGTSRSQAREAQRNERTSSMTWCVGMPFFLGCGLIISDIRVTWTDTGQKDDCLQKVYPVGPLIAASFAGSVLGGFVMMENLLRALAGLEKDHAWVPR